MELTSTAFQHNSPIPAEYTCDGRNISPPLKWGSVPEGVRSLVLICEDPDAPSGTWTHWVIYNIPAEVGGLEAGASTTTETLASGASQGVNDFRRVGYGGPCPPSGRHRYFFRLYALDAELKLKPGARKQEVVRAMEGHVLATGELMGTYSRK
jgi:hypothetical protein